MQPGDVYAILTVCTAVFVAPFSRLAFVIIVAWAVGHFAYFAGLYEHLINLTQHLAAAAFGMRFARSSACVLSWSLFAPLVTIDLIVLFSNFDPITGWWWVLGLSTLQLLVMPFGVDWTRARTLFRFWKEQQCWQFTIWEPERVAT